MFPAGVCWSWTARVRHRCTGIIKVSSGQRDKCLLSPSGRMSSVSCPAECMVASGRLLMLPCSVSAGLVELLVGALNLTSQILPKHIYVRHPIQGQQCQKGEGCNARMCWMHISWCDTKGSDSIRAPSLEPYPRNAQETQAGGKAAGGGQGAVCQACPAWFWVLLLLQPW